MTTNSTPLSHSHDLTRDQIIRRFRDRIAQKKRTKLTKDELGQLIVYFIEQLQLFNSPTQIQALCEVEIALLEEGYPQSTLASDYIPKYRLAIESAIAQGKIVTNKRNSHYYTHTQRVTGVESERFEHYALTYFKYDKQVYEALDKRSANTNRTRQVSLRKVNPHDYLLKLEELLEAQDKFAARRQAIAIAGLTGRRIGEVLAKGQFQLSNHPHLLRFEGHQKTLLAPYDIVTLIPAEQLLEYIEQFRASDEISPLLELEGDALTKTINQLDVQINRECVKHLNGIVPPLSTRSSISIHNLRSLWGAIAVWLFCPDNQHEYPFIQHYLGHAIDSNATGHYFRYQLVDRDGHPLRDKGVKLLEVGELPLFTDNTATASTLTKTETSTQTPAADTPDPISPTIKAPVDTAMATPGADTSDLTPVQSAPAVPLLDLRAAIDVPKDEAAIQPALPPPAPSPAYDDTDFKDQINADNTTEPVAQTIVQDKDSDPTVVTPANPTAATFNTGSKIIKLSYRERDRTRLTQLLDTISPTAGSQQEKMAALLDWATHQLSHPKEEDNQPNNMPDSQYLVATSEVTHGTGQRVDVAVDQTPAPSTPTPTPPSPSPLELLVAQTVTDQARTLGVLANRVEALESQLAVLQQERDHALLQLAQQEAVPTQLTQQLEHLQVENTQLRQELDRFEAIRRAFLGEQPLQEPAVSPKPAPTVTGDDTTPTPATAITLDDAISHGAIAQLQSQSTPTHKSPSSKAKATSSVSEAERSYRPRRRGQAIARAERIFHALIAWNEQHPDHTFAMTDWLLEGVFHINRKAAKQFCQDFHNAIRQHHSTIGIDNTRSHNRGRDTSALKAFVDNFIGAT